MIPHPEPFNRVSFITLNATRLFTAEQVANLIASHSNQQSELIPDCPYHKYQCAWDDKIEEHYCKKDNSVIKNIEQFKREERDKVLDVDTIGTLLNIIEKDCSRLTVIERQAYRKAKKAERELRQSKAGDHP